MNALTRQIETEATRRRVAANRIRVFAAPVNHCWEADQWREQDMEIRPLAELPGLLEASDAKYQLGCERYCGFLANDTTAEDGTHHGVSIQLPSGDWIEFKAIGGPDSIGFVRSDADGARVEYGDCFQDIDVSHWPIATGMRTTISLYDTHVRDWFLAHPPEFAVTIPDGSYMMETPEANFIVEDETEARVWTFVRTLGARDAAGAECPNCCEYDVQDPPDDKWRWHLLVVPTPTGLAWLMDPARVFPVELDPDVTAGALTGRLWAERNESLVPWADIVALTSADGGAANFYVYANTRHQESFGNHYLTADRGMMDFDVSAVAAVASATLHYYCSYKWADGGTICFDRIAYYGPTFTFGDFDQVSENDEGSVAVADISLDAWNSLPLDASGFDGRSNYCLWAREAHDRDVLTPNDNGGADTNYGIRVDGPNVAGHEMYLEIVLAQGDGLGPFTGHMIRGDGGMLSR